MPYPNGLLSCLIFGTLIFISQSFRLLSKPFIGRIHQSNELYSFIDSTVPTTDHRSQLQTFSFLKSLDERCERLSKFESEFLLSFWSEKLQGFQIFPNQNSGISITTSCIALMAILANPGYWKSYAVWDSGSPVSSSVLRSGKISLTNVVESIYRSSWRAEDTFQTQILISTLCMFSNYNEDDGKCKRAVELLLDRDGSRYLRHRDQMMSSYLRHQSVVALLALVDNDGVPNGDQSTAQVAIALERSNMVAFDDLCRQLAFYNCGDSANFDVIILSFSLLAYWDTSNSLFLSSFSKGVVPRVNIKLVQSALSVIFASQLIDGTWRKGEPINKLVSSAGRDIGNNYVFFFDLAASLLGSIGEAQPELLSPYLGQIERCITWAESNIQQEILPEYVDPLTGRKFGITVKGWRSNHLGDGGAVGWCTAQVFLGLSRIRKLLRRLITSNILTEFKGTPAPNEFLGGARTSRRDWERLMDADLELAGRKTALKTELHQRLLLPLERKESAELFSLRGKKPAIAKWYSDSKSSFNDSDRSSTNGAIDGGSQRVDTAGAAATGTLSVAGMVMDPMDNSILDVVPPIYSLILFGPPGTAKTTICTSIANYLGWNFLTIDTACFLADGLENIASRMSYIFSRLTVLERTIILFDEIEEFCLDRENPALGMESRMLTTAMLTQLNDLRRKQLSVFIVATNRLRSFDAAVTRPGRFDMLLFVGTPNLSSRIDRLKQKLAVLNLSRSQQDDVIKKVHHYLSQHWQELRFLTFAENESFLTTVVNFVKRGDLSDANMKDICMSLLRTSTIQGTIKDEYIASEVLSRQ